MRRFFIDNSSPLTAGAEIDLTGDEFHHLRNVCRLEEGERAELLDGDGKIAVAVIAEIGKKSARLTIEKVETLPAPPRPRVEIVLCVPRFQKMDVIIQKSVELGAARISPVVSERSFMKTVSKELTGKISRWNKIALEACKQSGRAWPMEIVEATSLQKRLQDGAERGLFLYEGEASIDIKSALEAISPESPPETLAVFVGPEGGFSPEEVEEFRSHGFPPVTMGPLVLRVETACIALLSVIDYHFGQLR